MTILEQAYALRAALDKLAEHATDAIASMAVIAYPKLDGNNTLIKSGTRINWNGVLKRATVDIWDTELNNPDNAPTLWEDINYREGYRIIPEVITVGLAFAEGEIGWWNNVLYRSKVNANVYTPDTYPDNWEVVE
jgi:hypothetical protein